MKPGLLILASLLALPAAASPLGKPAPLPPALQLQVQENGVSQWLALCLDGKGRFALHQALPQGQLQLDGQLQPLPGRSQPLLSVKLALLRGDGVTQSLQAQLLLDSPSVLLGAVQSLDSTQVQSRDVVPQYSSALFSIVPAAAGQTCPR